MSSRTTLLSGSRSDRAANTRDSCRRSIARLPGTNQVGETSFLGKAETPLPAVTVKALARERRVRVTRTAVEGGAAMGFGVPAMVAVISMLTVIEDLLIVSFKEKGE